MEREVEEMKKSLIFLISIFMILLTACSSSDNGVTAYTEVNVEEGITFTLKEDALKRSSATFILSNNTEDAVEYSPHEYHLEEMKEGQWKEFTGTAKSSWGDDTLVLEAGDVVELSYNWKTLCGNTSKGMEYRLIIMVNDSPVAAEFTGN